jgi:alkanesulfonate monooxygenase SsuD/methylene tetrahydromethanopterin reductase-like flavin-dependent oxidoreductase (luciferase family)
MAQLAFSVRLIDRGHVPLHQLYADRLEPEKADDAGFFCYHLAEHHGTPLGMAPSPAVFLAAAAQRTRRIRLGPLVYLLPLYSPLRLIEEVCMLDHLSGGRLELGIGRGVSPYELGHFGVNAAETRAIFNETLAILVTGLTHDQLTFAGERYHYQNVPMELRPLQRPYPPLWYPTTIPTASSMWHGTDTTSRTGVHARTPASGLAPQGLASASARPDRLNGHVAEPKVGVVRQVFGGGYRHEALKAARAARDWYRSITKLWHDHNDDSVDGLFAGRRPPSTRPSSSVSRARASAGLAAAGGERLQLFICSLLGAASPASRHCIVPLFVEEVMPALRGDTHARVNSTRRL